jgi:hypothetical protein
MEMLLIVILTMLILIRVADGLRLISLFILFFLVVIYDILLAIVIEHVLAILHLLIRLQLIYRYLRRLIGTWLEPNQPVLQEAPIEIEQGKWTRCPLGH